VNPGFDYWFSSQGDAVVGYTRHHGVRIVGGAPVCSFERLPDVIEEFHHDSGRDGICYFAAEQRVFDALGTKKGFAVEVLGAQPIWSPESWAQKFTGDRSLRAQLNRARNKGVTVSRLREFTGSAVPDLRRCLDEWLRSRRLPPMHFLIEPETLGNLQDRAVYIARRGETPVGFVALSPIVERRGWLSEQFIRGRQAPNGTVELMLDFAVHDALNAGADLFTMGIVPLSRLGDAPASESPAWLRWIENATRKVGAPFYDFEGLEHFKNKFHPDYWEPIYAISREEHFSPRTLFAIAAAFSGGHSGSLLGRGVVRLIKRALISPK